MKQTVQCPLVYAPTNPSAQPGVPRKRYLLQPPPTEVTQADREHKGWSACRTFPCLLVFLLVGLTAGAQVILYPNQITGTIAWNNPAGPVLNHLNAEGFGTVGGNGIVRADQVSSGPNQASKYFAPDSRTSTLYDLTVNGSDLGIAYDVKAAMTMFHGDAYYFAAAVSDPVLYDTVGHVPGPPVNLDLIECAGLIHVHYRSPSGVPVPVDASSIQAWLSSGPLQAQGGPVAYTGATDHTLIVRGGNTFNLRVSAQVHSGTDHFVDYVKTEPFNNYTVTVPCNGEVHITLTIPDLSGPPAGGYGQIIGLVDMLTENEHWVNETFTVMSAYNGPQGNFRLSDVGVQPIGPCGSPSSPFVGTPTCTSAGQFVLPNLLPSDFFPALNDPAGPRPYSLLGRLIYGTGQRFQRFETPVLFPGFAYNSPVTVTAGGTVDLGNTFVMKPGWVVGDVYLCCPDELGKTNSPLRYLNRLSDFDANLDGIPDNLAWDYTSQIIASGKDTLGTGATRTAAGAAGRTLFPGSFHDSGPDEDHFVGDYRLTLGGLKGEATRWDQRTLYLNFVNADPANHLSSQVIIRNNLFLDVEVVPEQTITNDHRYGLSRVVVTFHSDDPGTTLYNPRITGNGSWNGADFEGHAANYTAQIHYADGTPKDFVNAALDGQIIMCLPQGNYTFAPELESVNGGSSTHNVLPNFSQYVGPCSSITSTPCLQIAMTNAPDCPTNRLVTIAGSITSCTNVASITYKLNSDPVVTVCNNCGVNPSFSFGITLADCENHLTVSATDVNGGLASYSLDLHFDVTPPVLSGCTNFSTNSIAGTNGNFVSYTITALDNCDGPVPVVCSPPSGSFFPVGTTLVTCTAGDHCLNTNTCTFTVTVTGSGTNCCDDCFPPYPLTISVPVVPGVNYLANPLCHGTNNSLGALLPNVPDGTVLKKWDRLTDTYSPEYSFDSGFGGWVDSGPNDASGVRLEPGEGFLLINPNGPFTNTWTGCLPDCPPPCLPTNGCVLVGRRGPGTAQWSDLSSCPPTCGTEVRIWNGTGFNNFTFDPLQGWQPYAPVVAEGHSAFVCLDTNTVCCTNNLVVNGSFELTSPALSPNSLDNALDRLTGVPGWTTTAGEFLEVWANTILGIPAAHGVNQLEINAQSDDQTVSQTITNLSTNCPVEFCFQYTGRFGNVSNSPNNDFTVTLNGGFAMSVTLDPAQYATGGWLRFCTNFTPSSSTLTIAFRGQPHYSDGTQNTEGGAHIDNVSLTQCCDTNPCTTPPMLICATNKTVECVADWSFDPPTVQDPCCSNTPVNILSTTKSGGPCAWTHVRTWVATNCLGYTSTCTQTVTVVDTTPPIVAFCPTNVIACRGTNGCGIMPDATGQVLATDACSAVSVTQSIPVGEQVCSNTFVVFTITDACSNATVCVAPVFVQPCCFQKPSGMKLWLTFDESVGLTCLNSMGGNNGIRYEGTVAANNANGPTRQTGEYVNRSLCFDGTNDTVIVNSYGGINPGQQDFSMDLWVKWDGTLGSQCLLDKRTANADRTVIIGYALFLLDGVPRLILGDGNPGSGTPFQLPTALPANQWTHLAVTVDRNSSTGIRFYLDGSPASPTFSPLSHAQTLSTTAALWIGDSPIALADTPFRGCLDEIEFFRRVLTPAEIFGIYQARTKGKCRPFCTVPVVLSLCTNSVTIAATICNPGAAGQWFTVSFTGLTPLQSGLPSAVAWPSSPNPFSPAATTVYVGPNSCATIPITITRPPALYGSPLYGTQKVACYQMVVATPAGEKFSCEGRLVDGAWNCPAVVGGSGSWTTHLIAKSTNGVVIPFPLTNPTNVMVTLHPAVRVLTATDTRLVAETNVVSLNGLPPGTPWTGTVVLPPGDTTNLPVNVRFIETQPATPFYVILEANIGEGGAMEAIASATVLNENPATVGPFLNLGLSGGLPVISWDIVNSPFALESSGSLGGTNWAPVPELVVPLPDGSEGVILQGTNSARYFRGRQ